LAQKKFFLCHGGALAPSAPPGYACEPISTNGLSGLGTMLWFYHKWQQKRKTVPEFKKWTSVDLVCLARKKASNNFV